MIDRKALEAALEDAEHRIEQGGSISPPYLDRTLFYLALAGREHLAHLDGTLTPVAWPKCSECDVACVLRRGLSTSKGWIWVWRRDCKHKTAELVIETADQVGEP